MDWATRSAMSPGGRFCRQGWRRAASGLDRLRLVELSSSRDLLVWLVDVWESGGQRAGKLARGDSVLALAIAEEKISDGPLGLMDDCCLWFEDLRGAGWIMYDDTEAVKVRFPGARCSRNDVNLSRNFIVTAAGATFVKSSLTASTVGQVALDLAALIRTMERRIEEADAPEEAKNEARKWLSRAGEATLSSAAADLLVRVLLSLH